MERITKNVELNSEYKNIIYAVCDPDSFNPIYIGKSTTGINRPLDHIKTKSHSDELNNWIKELNTVNKSPIIIILESTNCETFLEDKETYWIKKYISMGFKLLNKSKITLLDEITIESPIDIANFIRDNRLFRKMSQDELSKKVNLSRSTISIIERGHENVSLVSLIKLIKFFNSKINIINNDVGLSQQ
jgi:DNA-binding XRE family transcriptional regulator